MEVDGGGEVLLPDLICMCSCARYQGNPRADAPNNVYSTKSSSTDLSGPRSLISRANEKSQAKGRPYPDTGMLSPLKMPRRTAHGDRCTQEDCSPPRTWSIGEASQ